MSPTPDGALASGRVPVFARGHRGFALPTAIFLLVVLAALGAFMLIISSVQHATSAQDVQGTRAYQAARAGIEWGVYQVMQSENTNPTAAPFNGRFACVDAPTTPAVIGTLANFADALSGFTVEVKCRQTKADEGGNKVRVYQLTATSWMGDEGAINRVQRQVVATVATCRQEENGGACCNMANGATQGCTGG